MPYLLRHQLPSSNKVIESRNDVDRPGINYPVHMFGYLSCQAHAIDAEGPGFDSRASQIGTVSPTPHHNCDVSSELRCPGAEGLDPLSVTCFGEIPRV